FSSSLPPRRWGGEPLSAAERRRGRSVSDRPSVSPSGCHLPILAVRGQGGMSRHRTVPRRIRLTITRRMIAPTSDQMKVSIVIAPLMLPLPSRPAMTAPMIPTTMLRMMPCCASVRMIRLASQPTIPPTINQTMIPMSFPSCFPAGDTRRPFRHLIRAVPAGELLEAQRIALAGVVDAQGTARHGRNDLGLPADHPAGGVDRRQRVERQRLAERSDDLGRTNLLVLEHSVTPA